MHGFLAVTPYYNKPPAEGLARHFAAIAAAADGLPVIIYNIPQRVILNLEPELLARLARESANVVAVKQATTDLDQARAILGCRARALRRQRRPARAVPRARRRRAASASPRTSSAPSMLRIVRARRGRRLRGARALDRELHAGLRGARHHDNPIPLKAALELIGLRVGAPRLPLVDGDRRAMCRAALRPCGERPDGRRVSDVVRIIPLGGLGQIGNNLCVIEQGERRILIDCGLSFPRDEMPGVDLVLPDFAYLRDAPGGIDARRAHARPRGPHRRAAVRACARSACARSGARASRSAW